MCYLTLGARGICFRVKWVPIWRILSNVDWIQTSRFIAKNRFRSTTIQLNCERHENSGILMSNEIYIVVIFVLLKFRRFINWLKFGRLQKSSVRVKCPNHCDCDIRRMHFLVE